MRNVLFTVATVLLLTACSTIIDGQTQNFTVLTPGANNAKCTLYNEDMRYVSYSGQTIEIMKSNHDLVVNCKAEGNRERTVLIKRELNGWGLVNVTNGFIPGATYDYFSRGGFNYPEKIEICFHYDPIKPYPHPDYMADELQSNHKNNKVEYMGPTTPVSEKYRYNAAPELEKKEIISYDPAPRPAPVMAKQGNDLNKVQKSYNPTTSYDPIEEDK